MTVLQPIVPSSPLPQRVLLLENSRAYVQTVAGAIEQQLELPVMIASTLAEARALLDRYDDWFLALTGLVLADGDRDEVVDCLQARGLSTVVVTGVYDEDLRERLEQDRHANVRQAGGELAGQLVAVLKEAADAWPPEDCEALADLAEEIYGFIGWPASKKKRERQAQIQALRQRS